MTEDVRPLTTAEFLRLRHRLVDDHDITLLDKLDEQLAAIAETDPDRAVQLFHALADSGQAEDRATAAIYVGCLYSNRPEQTCGLLAKLLQDANKDVKIKAFDTLTAMTDDGAISTNRAAHLAQKYYEAPPITT